MGTRIVVTAAGVRVRGELAETECARSVASVLPVEGRGNRWGDEIYFSIPLRGVALDETAAEVLEAGDLGYWPPGRALCIFFGPTPASRGEEIRAASPVCRIGRLEGDAAVLRAVPDGALVRIARDD